MNQLDMQRSKQLGLLEIKTEINLAIPGQYVFYIGFLFNVMIFPPAMSDHRNKADLIESATPCHDAQVVGSYQDSNLLHQTVLTSRSEDYTTVPQHLHSKLSSLMWV